jgi:hypothetical protein
MEELELARRDIATYLGECGTKYDNANLFIEIV